MGDENGWSQNQLGAQRIGGGAANSLAIAEGSDASASATAELIGDGNSGDFGTRAGAEQLNGLILGGTANATAEAYGDDAWASADASVEGDGNGGTNDLGAGVETAQAILPGVGNAFSMADGENTRAESSTDVDGSWNDDYGNAEAVAINEGSQAGAFSDANGSNNFAAGNALCEVTDGTSNSATANHNANNTSFNNNVMCNLVP